MHILVAAGLDLTTMHDKLQLPSVTLQFASVPVQAPVYISALSLWCLPALLQKCLKLVVLQFRRFSNML
jgi:hypothetical protein